MAGVSFRDQVVKEFKAADDRVWDAVKVALMLVFDDMVEGCPVDTGYLRSNIYMKSSPTDSVALAKDKIPGKTYDPPKRPRFRRSKHYTFGNNTEYAPLIEFFGWSKQAPNGFMRPALANFKTYLKDSLSGMKVRKRKWRAEDPFSDEAISKMAEELVSSEL